MINPDEFDDLKNQLTYATVSAILSQIQEGLRQGRMTGELDTSQTITLHVKGKDTQMYLDFSSEVVRLVKERLKVAGWCCGNIPLGKNSTKHYNLWRDPQWVPPVEKDIPGPGLGG